MLFNSFTASIFLLALTSSTNAQASTQGSPQSGSVFAPALGNPNPGLSDVQRPSETAPCGGQTIGSNLGSSTPVAVGSNMQFNIQVTSFGAGTNNSRSIQTAKVDPKGTGESFVDCQIITNGDADPSAAGTQQVTLQLPDNTKCVGGDDGKRCLVAITTDKGDGNCLVLTQPTQSSTATDGGKAQTDAQKGDQTKTNDQKSQKQNPGSNQPKMIRKRRA